MSEPVAPPPAAATPVLSDQDVVDEPTLLRAYLAGRDVACPQCGYNLRELVGTRCPECGEELTLRVQPVEPRQAALLAGLVVLSAGAGMNALLLIYLVIQIYYYRPGSGGWGSFAAVNLIEGLVMGACVAAWLLCWRRIRRIEAWRRWLLVAACAALTLADLIFFAKLIR
jgi:hypothetical protein